MTYPGEHPVVSAPLPQPPHMEVEETIPGVGEVVDGALRPEEHRDPQAPLGAMGAEGYLPFVRRIAYRVSRKLPTHVDVEDLVGAGTVGLMEALNRYSPEGGRTFETYAEFRIKGAMLDELRRADPLNRATRDRQSKASKAATTFANANGRMPEDAELAQALNVSMDTFVGRFAGLNALRFVGVDNEDVSIPSEEEDQETGLARKQMTAQVRNALGNLTERQQIVLNLYYIEELTQAQIGTVLGISESRVCQVLSECHRRIKAQLKDVG